MPVCKFFLQGNCRFGDRCKNDHPQNAPAPRQNNQNQRFSSPPRNQRHNSPPRNARHNDNNNRQAPRAQNARNTRSSNPGDPKRDYREYKLMNQESIDDDMTIERPEWICSAYGPVSGLCARQLFGGPMEISAEEARVEYYLSALGGNVDKARADQEGIWTQSQAQIIQVIQDLPGAVKYIRDGANERPNRADIVNEVNRLQPGDSRRGANRDFFSRDNARRRRRQEEEEERRRARSGAFAQPQNPSPFGQPQQAAPFGQTPPAANPFGQAQPAPQPAQQPTPQANAFATPPQPLANNAFGQPQQNAFSAPQPPQVNGAFGQPQPAAFANPPQPVANNAFGQPQPGGAFGQPQPQPQPAPFGQAQNNFGQHAPIDLFAQPSTPFQQQQQQPAQAANMPMSNTSAFPALPQQQQQPQFQQQQQQQPAPPQSTIPNQPTDPTTTYNSNGTLQSWKGQPVQYKGAVPYSKQPNGQLQRIWHARGAPPEAESVGKSLPPTEAYPADVRTAYEQLLATGEFAGGAVPLMAPRPEWCGWDV